ncbi:MAG: hypothetical protein ACYCPS_00755 [Candidatus Saccharimonadales bacterium]
MPSTNERALRAMDQLWLQGSNFLDNAHRLGTLATGEYSPLGINPSLSYEDNDLQVYRANEELMVVATALLDTSHPVHLARLTIEWATGQGQLPDVYSAPLKNGQLADGFTKQPYRNYPKIAKSVQRILSSREPSLSLI